MPYYLHKLDPVRGTAHFDCSEESGIDLIEEVRKSVPGYCIPTFVAEIPGAQSKTPLIQIGQT